MFELAGRRKLCYISSGNSGETFGLNVCTDSIKTSQKGAGVISDLGSVCEKEHLTVTGKKMHLWCPERQKTEG